MKKLDQIVMALLIFAGINWGIWGLFEFNLVGYIFGREWVDRLFYVILGLAGVYVAIGWCSIHNRWSHKKK